jgi:anti-sigma B factor antagonist
MTADDAAALTPPATAPDADAVVRQRSPGLVIEVKGDLDAATTPRVLAVITSEMSEQTTTVTLDCAGVRFCDSAGLGGLIRLTHDVPAEVRVLLRAPSRPLVRLLEITGSRSLFAFS